VKKARVVERFKIRTVWLHWIHTLFFLALIATGAMLFFPELSTFAASNLSRLIHRISAVFFIVIPLLYVPFNLRASLHFVKDIFVWGKNDIIWISKAPDYYFGGDESKMLPQGHINTGQKMWQSIVLATGVLFLVTGGIMWFLKDLIPLHIFQWCQICHDIAFIVSFLMLMVHIYLGVIHPRMTESLLSMLDGKISINYAEHHYGRWYEEMTKGNK